MAKFSPITDHKKFCIPRRLNAYYRERLRACLAGEKMGPIELMDVANLLSEDFNESIKRYAEWKKNGK